MDLLLLVLSTAGPAGVSNKRLLGVNSPLSSRAVLYRLSGGDEITAEL